MVIGIAADHGGFLLKDKIMKQLKLKGLTITDFGCDTTDDVDYPDYALRLSQAVAQGKCTKGIVICGTGIGVSITANKVAKIRCALAHDLYTAEMAAKHNDSNVLAIGAKVVPEQLAIDMVETWLECQFEGGRHERRLGKIRSIETGELPN